MKENLSIFLFCNLLIASCTVSTTSTESEDILQYVDTFVGNSDNGHTFPGACTPFGMTQVSPETGNDSWRYCSGFNFEDDSIIGFAQTHLNGTGCSDLGDILLFPFTGEVKDGIFKSGYDKTSQTASPGYYKVKLTDSNIDVELTATQRTAYHIYTYNNAKPAHMLLDMQSGVVWDQKALRTHVLQSESNMPDNRTITGHQEVTNWVQRHYYYVIKFDKPYTLKETLAPRDGEKAKRMILAFDLAPGESLQVKIAMSTTGID